MRKFKCSNLKVGSLNIGGSIDVKSDFSDFVNLVKSLHVCSIQETWLIEARSFNVEGYICYRSD